MPILPGEPPAGWPLTATDFAAWWLPEFAIAAGFVCAGLTLWAPFAVVAVIPLLGPLMESVHLARAAWREARHAPQPPHAQQAFAELEPALPAPVAAHAERIDRRLLGQSEPVSST